MLGTLCVFGVVPAARTGTLMMAMAQDQAGPETLPGRNVLVSGSATLADGKTPAIVTIDIGDEPMVGRPQLELTLAPESVVPNEPYLIVVSLMSDGTAKRLGTASFFPPQIGKAREFYFDAAPFFAETKARGTSQVGLSIALVPADRRQTLTASAVRVVGARLVTG